VKPTKLTSFFEGHRRRAFLVAWTHLKTTAGESRIKLNLRVPLLNESVIGMEENISAPFSIMAKDGSTVGRTSVNVELDGMTLDCFATHDPVASKERIVSSTGVKMVKLALNPASEDEKKEINLEFVAYVPASVQVRDWAWTHLHQEFGLEAVYSQSELTFDDPGDDDLAGEEEEEEEEPAAPPRKSGPRELAAYHSKHKVN
jgi:hypothetical protein